MTTQQTSFSSETIGHLSARLHTWAGALSPVAQAMLVDLLAKAGGDVYGVDGASRAVTPAGAVADSSALSPLESEDFTHALAGILAADRHDQPQSVDPSPGAAGA